MGLVGIGGGSSSDGSGVNWTCRVGSGGDAGSRADGIGGAVGIRGFVAMMPAMLAAGPVAAGKGGDSIDWGRAGIGGGTSSSSASASVSGGVYMVAGAAACPEVPSSM